MLAHRRNLGVDRGAVREVGAHLGQVRAGAEDPEVGPQLQHADVGIGGQRVEGGAERRDEAGPERVDGRAGQREEGDRAPAREPDRRGGRRGGAREGGMHE